MAKQQKLCECGHLKSGHQTVSFLVSNHKCDECTCKKFKEAAPPIAAGKEGSDEGKEQRPND